jgi:membrane fusion protein (multidrug efflux system)
VTVATEVVPITSELPARVVATRSAQVRARVTGVLQNQLFADGADVTEGQLLFQIDQAPLQAVYDSAKATLAKAEATLLQTKTKAARYAELVKINAVSRQDNDEASATLAEAEADVLSSKAAVKTAELNLGYARVVSPITGRVGKALVTEGAFVSASEFTPLALVRQLDPVHVDFSQSSTEMLQLRRALANGSLQGTSSEAARVTLKLEDGSTYECTGKLLFSDISVDETTGMITLRAEFPNPNKILLPGMFVRVQLAQAVNQKALTVLQRSAVRNADGSATVLVVNSQNRVEARNIKADTAFGNKWIVSSGLAEGERVIVEGLQKVIPGAPVTPVPFKESSASAPSTASSASQGGR